MERLKEIRKQKIKQFQPKVKQPILRNDELLIDAILTISEEARQLRDRANDHVTQIKRHECHVESLDGGLESDDPESTTTIGKHILKAARQAENAKDTVESLRKSAERLEASAIALVPPSCVSEQIRRYEEIRAAIEQGL
jgi:hypothetical protein